MGVRLWLVRFRMRLGGIAVWVCPACREVWYAPAWWLEVNCVCSSLEGKRWGDNPSCFRLRPRHWHLVVGRPELQPAEKV